jgi:MFS family permease
MPASSITTYVALSFSAYAASQFLTNLMWGVLSDRFGRKPMFLLGTVGIMVSTLGLGFATSAWEIVFWRACMGLLSGNVVVVRTMVGEMVGTDNPASQGV